MEPMIYKGDLLPPITINEKKSNLDHVVLFFSIKVTQSTQKKLLKGMNGYHGYHPLSWFSQSTDESTNTNSSFDFQSICQGRYATAMNSPKRVDYLIQKNCTDYMDYIYFLKAHSSYW